MQQPVVVAALDKLWSAANFDDSDAIIDNKEYIVMQGSWYTSSLALALGCSLTRWVHDGASLPQAQEAGAGA